MIKYDYNKLLDKINKYKNMSINDINIDDLDDVDDIKIDKRKDSTNRILKYLNDSKNPYAFKVKDKIVKIAFSDNNISADDCLSSVLNQLYK